MTERCAVCKYWNDLQMIGPVALCLKHANRYMWDSENEYLRQKKRGGKWHYIWESQTNLAKAIEKIGYRVDSEVMPLWAVSKKGVLMPFDIAIPELNVLVEYQGEQHRKQISFFFKSSKAWMAYIRRQEKKKKLAIKNGWKLIEFTKEDQPFDGREIKRRLTSGKKTKTTKGRSEGSHKGS